uniref:Uncharacterized protein n=1 Tax=Romanomermis culicivorax TaxID=13658 RepID=A0A915IM40_ROMCU
MIKSTTMLSRKINNIAGFLSRRRLILNHLSSISTSRSNFFAENGRGLNQNLGEDFEEFERSISFPARKYDCSENISESNSISKQNNAYKSSQHYSKSEDTLLYQASRDPSVIPKFLENFDQWWFDFCNRLMNMSPGRLSYAVKTLGDFREVHCLYDLTILTFTNKVVKFFQNDNDQSTDSGVADVLFCDCIHKLSVLRTYPDAESIHFIVEKMKDVMHSWQNRLEKIIKSIEKLDIDNHDFSDPNVSDRGNGDYFNGTEIVSEMLRFLVIHNEIASTFINWHFDPDQCVTQAQQQIASFWRTWFKNAKHAFALSSTEKFHSISLKIVDQSKERYFWGLVR